VKRWLTWAFAAVGITMACVAVFILAAALFPGNPGRFYLIAGSVVITITLAWRLLGLPMR
jgi:hypothetical protein